MSETKDPIPSTTESVNGATTTTKASSSSGTEHKQVINLEQDKELIEEKSLLASNEILSKESDDGNVEYKWKLVGLSEDRFKHLVTQMSYRLSEGQGEAIYEIGINDDGYPLGLVEEEYRETLGNIEKMAIELQATVSVICEKQVSSEGKKNKKQAATITNPEEKRWVAEVLVRRFGEEEYLNVNIAVCGNVDSGKSTLIGVLTHGQLDNGRGLARSNVFVHKHELTTGRTSSISHQIMGFDSKGDTVNYSNLQSPSWKDIIDKSSKVCTFIDLAGHEKYLKTTVFGMTTGPDYALLCVGSNMGVTKMTKEHIGLCLALKIPMFFCITKVDICPENILKQTIETIHKILKLPGVRKLPYHVKNDDDVLTCAKNLASDRICPMFLMSSVTGENLQLLHKFLNLLPIRKDWESLIDKPAQYVIDQTFFVSGVGTVVSGIVQSGSISVNDKLMLGPDSNGHFRSVVIKSIHCKRVNVKRVHAGQQASFALKKERRSGIRKGMVIVDEEEPKAVWEFEADILVLYHSTTIKENYQPVIHCNCIRQSAKLVKINDNESLRTGEKAKVKFRFLFRPEYLRVGERLIFREGTTKGLGVISQVFK
ncbi:GTP-binding elongation factor Tu [Naegleria gruberi]|uniref:GTP-binding elongation factor Tu n=1 Tax=Naegleria gruberi TaxID=5762 RepID=D2V2M8_NAEGR|nr:GTP-binding elongation factor Tu [Naegleria gruberi]EFC49087.1 GTP-binding elongation factor Tu [Naegleria gruberi]|eukprot:XP_002681831.1 GTP-binding elongation factor Tu [Naegleria gruberi strain NEG-M]